MSLSSNQDEFWSLEFSHLTPIQLVALSPLRWLSKHKYFTAYSRKNRYSGIEMPKKEYSDSIREAFSFPIF